MFIQQIYLVLQIWPYWWVFVWSDKMFLVLIIQFVTDISDQNKTYNAFEDTRWLFEWFQTVNACHVCVYLIYKWVEKGKIIRKRAEKSTVQKVQEKKCFIHQIIKLQLGRNI